MAQNMSIHQLIQTIHGFSSEQQQAICELYQAIDILYQTYGKKLQEESMLQVVSKESADLAALITSTHHTIGLDKVHELLRELQRTNKTKTLDITGNHIDSIKSDIQSTQKDIMIHTHQDDILGLRVQSSQGQLYERTLDKDIAKLTR